MLIVLDLETTWLSPKEDTIIECAFIKIDRKTFQEIDRYTTFVDPKREIPELISGITNIFQSDVEWQPVFSDVCWDIEDFIEWYPLVGHNISFDISFLESHWVDTSKNPYIDTFFLANFLCFHEKSLNLWHLCEVFDIDLKSAHRAIDDTLATVKVFQKLIERLQDLEVSLWELAVSLMDMSRDAWLHVLKNEYLADIKIIKQKDDIFTHYISYIEQKKYDKIDKIHQEDTVKIDTFLNSVDGFELRESQKIMLDKVDNNFSQWWRCIIEAPTGTGKTLAYLLPAIKYSLISWEWVHISTSTKALQDQIFYKDLLFLSENLDYEFSYTKLKGKRNYMSFHNFGVFFDIQEIVSPWVVSFILKMMLWSLESKYGELEELDFYGEEYKFLHDIHAWNAFVFDEGNIYKKYEFAVKARNRAKSANIIITNNHILFQDIVWEGNLLWGVKNLVLDEAHSLEDIVTNSLKKTFSYTALENLTGKIIKKLQKNDIKNMDIERCIQRILFESHEIFAWFEASIFEKFSHDMKYKNILIQEEYFKKNDFLDHIALRILQDIALLLKELKKLWEKYDQYLSWEQQELEFITDIFGKFFFKRDFDTYIYYISHSEQKGTEFSYTVLRPWNFLQSRLWKNIESVLLTSATLQMWDDFSYMKNSLELQSFESMTLPSDFDYNTQALVYIPNDLWSIKYNLAEIINFLWELFHIVKWTTLVLFTSYMNIKETYLSLKAQLQKKDITLLAQSISWWKHKQIEYFKKHSESSILLGTDAFWEGIDIPWDDLKYLVIHKIPFQVPSDPIFQARANLYEDSFREYSIPKSILKLKQGFWRLIRSTSDTWVVIFLDDRIYTTSWWKEFLHAFPNEVKVKYGKAASLLEILRASK